MIAIQFGRPFAIQDRDIDIELPINLDANIADQEALCGLFNAQALMPDTNRPGDEYRVGYGYFTSVRFHLLSLISRFMLIIVIFILRFYYIFVNAKRDREAKASGLSEEEMERLGKIGGENDLTDIQNPYFRYSY
ncbi:uncharacterized protein I206_107831 [Kwoniella pini CBS 10737]|uniref:Uncharacterized protein n=1 Tax=Kwoniella pini CBS 10737 TaxID=1296096 RepID=A0A1B9HYF1_9TREE|nr:uncharacterized protein I206_06164 [Kwoniella pini CBS 10737]OCF48296.1 hypothetical protein I206_06164 [Kwoniella pini CBS 10737]